MYELTTKRKGRYEEIPLDILDSSPFQHRETQDLKKLEELKLSLKKEGLLQPIVAVKRGDRYEIVAGHRRVQAARELGWKNIDVNVLESLSNLEEKTLTENLVRENINPVERAKALDGFLRRKLTENYVHNLRNIEGRMAKGEQVSFEEKEIIDTIHAIGMTVHGTIQIVKILELPEDIKDMIEYFGKTGSARKKGNKIPWIVGTELTRIANPALQREVAQYLATNKIGIQKSKEIITRIVKNPDRYKDILKGRGFENNPANINLSTISHMQTLKGKLEECTRLLNGMNQSQLARLYASSEAVIKRLKEFQKSVTDLIE